MANEWWDRTIINQRERPLSSDINTAQAQMDRTLREYTMHFFKARTSVTSDRAQAPVTGFVGEGLRVRPLSTPGLGVLISQGLGFKDGTDPGDQASAIGGVVGCDDLSRYKPLPLLNDATINGISAGPGAGNSRIDIVEVRMNRVQGNPLSRDVLSTLTGLFVAGTVQKTMSFALDGSTGVVTSPAASTAAISYKMGIAGVVPVAPLPMAGYTKIATILIDTSLLTVTRGKIIDERIIASPYGQTMFQVAGNIPSGAAAPPVVSTFDAPPGYEIAVMKDAQPAQNRYSVWAFGGNAGAALGRGGGMYSSVIRPSYSAGEFFAVQSLGTTVGLLTAPDVALLADAAQVTPGVAWAVGTPYMRTQFYAVRQAAGVTDAAVPDPLPFDVYGFVRHY